MREGDTCTSFLQVSSIKSHFPQLFCSNHNTHQEQSELTAEETVEMGTTETGTWETADVDYVSEDNPLQVATEVQDSIFSEGFVE
jgi:hypothetical protein